MIAVTTVVALTDTLVCKCGARADIAVSGQSAADAMRQRRRFTQENDWHKHGPVGAKEWTCGKCYQGRLMPAAQKSAEAKARNPSKVNVAEAVELWNAGATLEELGQRYGTTRERVRQKIKGLIKHDRPRNEACPRCGKSVQVPKTVTKAVICGECRNRACGKCGESVGLGSTSGLCHRCSQEARRVFDEPLVVHLYRNGVSTNRIAEFIGHGSAMSIWHVLKRNAVKTRRSGPTGERVSQQQMKRLAREYRAKAKQ